jgi:DNA-binding HxlR family transcriptional regulator
MKLEKITESRHRSYADACGAAHALDLVGERWALLVMREMMLGPRRFGDLRASLPGISANVLTQRLEGLEANGIVERRRLPPPASAQVYALTDWGLESEPIFQALGRWAARSPAHDPTLPVSAVSVMLSLRTMIDPVEAAALEAEAGPVAFGFRLGADGYLGRLGAGTLAIAAEPLGGAEVVFSGRAPGLAAAVYGKVPFEALDAQGLLRVEGDRALAHRFVGLFALPPKVAPAA